ncbi:MAG TPA: c-type cytochrome, partial [Verrucomicrobiae bacterium]
ISSRLQLKLAQTLAATPAGADRLLKMVRVKQAPASLLQERTVREKLLAARPENAALIAKLTEGLPPTNEKIQKLIDKRRAAYTGSKANAAHGNEVFTQNCRVCHQLDNQGGLVGPQLDGVGNRGLERLCEDVLDPNRSVDQAFHVTMLVLKDGDVVSGLVRREEGENLVLADATGKENSVAKKQIQERKETQSSLMPDNFGEILTQENFNDLMAYLLSKGLKGAAQK